MLIMLPLPAQRHHHNKAKSVMILQTPVTSVSLLKEFLCLLQQTLLQKLLNKLVWIRLSEQFGDPRNPCTLQIFFLLKNST
jgi:hypothetical protein